MNKSEKTVQPRILIIEDDLSTCDNLSLLLKPHFSLSFAHTIQETRILLESKLGYDIALLDLTLPDGDGATLLSELARNNILSIVLTMHNDLEHAIELMAQGAFYYLTKSAS